MAMIAVNDQKRLLDNFDLFKEALKDYDYINVSHGDPEDIKNECNSLYFFINICDSIDRSTVSKDIANELDKYSFYALVALTFLRGC